MSTPILSAAELNLLRRYNSPTISNAIELFDVRPRDVGYLPHTIRCLMPNLGPIVGYAVTSRTRASRPKPTESNVDLLGEGLLRYVASVPGPKIAVAQDLDDPPGVAAQFGEVMATIYQKLGCVGHITNGCQRDLEEVEALGFALFGLNPSVSHGYLRLVDFGSPVTIGGVEINSGDLLHADKHGVCLIPHEVAPQLAEACATVESRERPMLRMCRAENFSLEEYIKLRVASLRTTHE